MPKDKKLFSKIFIIFILVLMVVGFSVPLFNLGGNGSTDPTQKVDPRLCQSDSDCYLVCDDKPLTILCSRNLCLQNACDEYALYPFQETPLGFDLNILIEGKELDLSSRTDAKDVFVKFDGTVKVFSWGLPLSMILEKMDILLDENCLTVDNQQYCASGEKTLKYVLNGDETLPNPNYYPKAGDTIEIQYTSN